MANLEVHHQQYRGNGGNDSELNLITLCAAYHAQVHSGQHSAGFPKQLSTSEKLNIGQIFATWRSIKELLTAMISFFLIFLLLSSQLL
jgi:hypothetical protein